MLVIYIHKCFVNAYTDLPIRGKYIPLTKTIIKPLKIHDKMTEYKITQYLTVLTVFFMEKFRLVILYHKKFTGTRGSNFTS